MNVFIVLATFLGVCILCALGLEKLIEVLWGK
jgi:hypothetical protein